ncbi:hypothetical protein, partial [Escherichia coli]|uniref:hypothetical protein n=1 Tax=Escherichia coli TaxID=562 RepID=UPI00321634AB
SKNKKKHQIITNIFPINNTHLKQPENQPQKKSKIRGEKRFVSLITKNPDFFNVMSMSVFYYYLLGVFVFFVYDIVDLENFYAYSVLAIV